MPASLPTSSDAKVQALAAALPARTGSSAIAGAAAAHATSARTSAPQAGRHRLLNAIAVSLSLASEKEISRAGCWRLCCARSGSNAEEGAMKAVLLIDHGGPEM